MKIDDDYYYYLTNVRGDIIGLIDKDGNLASQYSYDDWGNITVTADNEVAQKAAELNIYRYVGKYGVTYDKDTNLYFMGFRDYDPTTERFIVPDTYHGEDDRPFSQNRYMYGHGDPVNNIDPSGHATNKVTKPSANSSKPGSKLVPKGTSKTKGIYVQGLGSVTIDTSKIGTGKVGDFSGLKNPTLDEILSRIPANAKNVGFDPIPGRTEDGFKLEWKAPDGTTWTVWGHEPDPVAPQGSNSANGWTFRIEKDPVKGRSEYWNGAKQKFEKDTRTGAVNKSNDTHNPMQDPTKQNKKKDKDDDNHTPPGAPGGGTIMPMPNMPTVPDISIPDFVMPEFIFGL